MADRADLNRIVREKVDAAIAESPDGWAITEQERSQLYDSACRYAEAHDGLMPTVSLERKAAT
jgi:hypothetical protein